MNVFKLNWHHSLIREQLIKKLSATPVITAQGTGDGEQATDPQTSLQANKATFFFRLERELEKVNTFYLQKEAEVSQSMRNIMNSWALF